MFGSPDAYLSASSVIFEASTGNALAILELLASRPDENDFHDGRGGYEIAIADLEGIESQLAELGAIDFWFKSAMDGTHLFLGDSPTEASDTISDILALSNIEMEEPECFPDLLDHLYANSVSFHKAGNFAQALYLPAEFNYTTNEETAARYIFEEVDGDGNTSDEESAEEYLERKLDELGWELVGPFLLMC